MNQENSSALRCYFPLSLLWEKLHSQAPGLPEDLQTPIKDDDINAIGSIKVIKLEGMVAVRVLPLRRRIYTCSQLYRDVLPPSST